MIIHSSTEGDYGNSEYITVSGKTQGCLSVDNMFWEKDEVDKNDIYKDIALIKNNLFVLKTDGLRFLDLNKKISNKKLIYIKTDLSKISKIIKSPNEKLFAINESEYELINTTNY